eukprot:scpid37851/ scgid17507/ 
MSLTASAPRSGKGFTSATGAGCYIGSGSVSPACISTAPAVPALLQLDQTLLAQRDTAANKECALHRPTHLSLRRLTVEKNLAVPVKAIERKKKFRATGRMAGDPDPLASDGQQQQQQYQTQTRSGCTMARDTDCNNTSAYRSVDSPTTANSGVLTGKRRVVTAAVACSSASSSASSSSSSSSDDTSIEDHSHHEESGFVSAASSVCLDEDTPLSATTRHPPPHHRPKPSALNLPGCEELPIHQDLVNASHSEPGDIEVVVLANYEPCCEVEIRVQQGQYATALYQNGAWLYVRLPSRNPSGKQEGYVPSEFCNLALLSPGTLDELSNDFDTMACGDPFSPPKQLTVFNSLANQSQHLSSTTDSTHPVRYDVAQVQQKSGRVSTTATEDLRRPKSQNSTLATRRAVNSSPTHSHHQSSASSRRHSYTVQSDTEGYTSRSKNIVAELNVRTRKAPGRARVTADSRPQSSYQSSKVVQSDYETWTRVPSSATKGRTSADGSPRAQRAKYESDAEFAPSERKRSNTISDMTGQQRPSKQSKLVQRLRNFRSKGSTLKHSSLDGFATTTGTTRGATADPESPEHNGFEGRRAHAVQKRSPAPMLGSPKPNNGYTSDTEILNSNSKLRKSSKRRSIFSSLRRLNGGGSQTDTEEAGGSKRRWTSLHRMKKEKSKQDGEQRMIYDEPPMRRPASLPRPSQQDNQSNEHSSNMNSLQRMTTVYVPSVAACNFIGKNHLGQVSLKEGQRVFKIVPANDSKPKKSTSSGWVLVMDPWTKREGMVPQSCISSLPTAAQSTVL